MAGSIRRSSVERQELVGSKQLRDVAEFARRIAQNAAPLPIFHKYGKIVQPGKTNSQDAFYFVYADEVDIDERSLTEQSIFLRQWSGNGWLRF